MFKPIFHLNQSIILAFICSIISCTSQQDIESLSNDVTKNNIEKRTIQDAIEIAKSVNSQAYGLSRSERVTVDEKNVAVVCSERSRSVSDTLLYIVNNTDGNGFTIVSTPANVTPIIAITESGEFGDEETASNTEFQYALAAAKNYVSAASEVENASTTSSYDLTNVTINELNDPRITVKWSQDWPQNIYCPNSVAGCAPVAMGQVCSYFSEPKELALSFDGKDQDTVELDWDDIKAHTSVLSLIALGSSTTETHFKTCKCSEKSHYDIGRFIRELGELAYSTYKTDGTGTWTYNYNTRKTLINLLPSHTITVGSSVSTLYDLIKSGGVACTYGEDSIAGGHMWVTDATGRVGYRIDFYELTNEGLSVYKYSETVIDLYLHYNWGWGGNCNGYFLLDAFAPGNAYKYDSQIGVKNTSDYDFDYNFYFIHVAN